MIVKVERTGCSLYFYLISLFGDFNKNDNLLYTLFLENY
jgi:hypothetical protein